MGRLWIGYGSVVGRNRRPIRIRLLYGRYGIRTKYAYSDSTAIRVLDGAPFPIRVKHLLRCSIRGLNRILMDFGRIVVGFYLLSTMVIHVAARTRPAIIGLERDQERSDHSSPRTPRQKPRTSKEGLSNARPHTQRSERRTLAECAKASKATISRVYLTNSKINH